MPCASGSPSRVMSPRRSSYRLAPKYPFPAAVHDVKAAVRWLRANAAEVPHRPRPDRRHGRLGGRPPRAVPRRDRRRRRFEGTAATPGIEPRRLRGQLLRAERLHQVVRQERRCRRGAAAVPRREPGEGPPPPHHRPARSPGSRRTPHRRSCIHGTKDPYVAYEQATWLVDRLKAAEWRRSSYLGRRGTRLQAATTPAAPRKRCSRSSIGTSRPRAAGPTRTPTACPTPPGATALYCTGFAFAEGPAIDREGNLYVVNYRDGHDRQDHARRHGPCLCRPAQTPPGGRQQNPELQRAEGRRRREPIGAETGTSQVIRIVTRREEG